MSRRRSVTVHTRVFGLCSPCHSTAACHVSQTSDSSATQRTTGLAVTRWFLLHYLRETSLLPLHNSCTTTPAFTVVLDLVRTQPNAVFLTTEACVTGAVSMQISTVGFDCIGTVWWFFPPVNLQNGYVHSAEKKIGEISLFGELSLHKKLVWPQNTLFAHIRRRIKMAAAVSVFLRL